MPNCIDIINLTKKFKETIVLNDLNLKVEKGIIYGLLGPNGAGKTTLIRILCGLTGITGGDAYVLNKKLPDSTVKSDIGYMPQDIALYTDLTVHENIILYGQIYGMRARAIAEREAELLKLVDLEEKKNEMFANLSGGMKRRISLICSMVHSPAILFLDEPTVGVDPELKIAFWEHFNELKNKGTTILISTHYMDEASNCDKVGLLRQGILIADDTPPDILSQTAARSLEDAFLILAKKM